MRMYDLIDRKKRGTELTREEIAWMIKGYVEDNIPDYQMSAMLMAIYLKGMTPEELTNLTLEMAHSGDMVDLSPIEGVKVDKHSTGGVGDKTTLIVGPIVAALGVKVAKMSGRGLGHTGGTVDKLESIPGYETAADQDTFFGNVNKIGISLIGQSGNLAPADKKIYALRDVTATVDSIPLIAASIMSKKLAAGSDAILLDVTVGSGAFMKEYEEALELARTMVSIGENAGRRTVALITDMDVPLGRMIGNACEIREVVDVLQGKGPEDLREVCLALASDMLYLAGKGSYDECKAMCLEVLEDGRAYRKFLELVENQGGDCSVFEQSDWQKPAYSMNYAAEYDGYITHMNTEQWGVASVMLGAGREKKDSVLDMTAGIEVYKKTGDYVKKGDVIAVLFTSRKGVLEQAVRHLSEVTVIGSEKPVLPKQVIARIMKEEETVF